MKKIKFKPYKSLFELQESLASLLREAGFEVMTPINSSKTGLINEYFDLEQLCYHHPLKMNTPATFLDILMENEEIMPVRFDYFQCLEAISEISNLIHPGASTILEEGLDVQKEILFILSEIKEGRSLTVKFGK
jgi:hypothetical protein